MKPYRFFTPVWLIGLPALVSFLVWAVPGTSLELRGFDARAPLELGGVLLIISWYAACIILATLGMYAGQAIPRVRPIERAQRQEGFDLRFYAVLSVVALIGVIGTYAIISQQFSIFTAISGGAINKLSEGLQSGSSIATLRYATIVAAPVGVYLWLRAPRSGILIAAGIGNVILLLLNSVLSSRLSLLMSLTVLAFLYFTSHKEARIRLWPTVIAGGALLVVLTVFNYLRNSPYYSSLGVTNPLEMNFYQIAAYVGTPAQVSVGVANGIVAGRYPETTGNPWDAVIPTFFRDSTDRSDRSVAIDPGAYGYQVDVAPNFNANSSFAELFSRFGGWGLVLAALGLAIGAVAFGYFGRYGAPISAASGVLAFTFIDFWRSYLLNTGVVIFAVGLVVGATVIAMVWGVISSRVKLRR